MTSLWVNLCLSVNPCLCLWLLENPYLCPCLLVNPTRYQQPDIMGNSRLLHCGMLMKIPYSSLHWSSDLIKFMSTAALNPILIISQTLIFSCMFISVGATLPKRDDWDLLGIVGKAFSRAAINSSSVLPNRSCTVTRIHRFYVSKQELACGHYKIQS